jgi:hypothetical protein
MKIQEQILPDVDARAEIEKWVAMGEGLYLEFKRKAAHPEKIIRELIAFANTEGGKLLIGIDDDGTIPGIKYPEEELHVIEEALRKYCRPVITFQHRIVALNKKKFVVVISVPVSDRKPHRLVMEGEPPAVFVRVKDMSVKASRELQEIVRRSRKKANIRFTYGAPESALMKYLEEHPHISLSQFSRLAKLNRFKASRKLVTLVLANVLKLTPGQPDLYSRVA